MNARTAYNLRARLVGELVECGHTMGEIVQILRLESKETARKLAARARRLARENSAERRSLAEASGL